MIKNSIKKKYGSYENAVLQNPDVAKKLGKVLNNKTLYDVVSRDMNDPDIDSTSKKYTSGIFNKYDSALWSFKNDLMVIN